MTDKTEAAKFDPQQPGGEAALYWRDFIRERKRVAREEAAQRDGLVLVDVVEVPQWYWDFIDTLAHANVTGLSGKATKLYAQASRAHSLSMSLRKMGKHEEAATQDKRWEKLVAEAEEVMKEYDRKKAAADEFDANEF